MPARLSSAQILVVDDAEFSLRLITTALMKYGFTKIYNAKDGVEALEKTHCLKPDLIILDLEMPNLDGFDYCESIRIDRKLRSIPIIVQTALNTRATKLRALSCGADDFVYKPFDAEEMGLRVCVHLERYFLLQDMQRMCRTLQIELALAENLLLQMERSEVPAIVLDSMRKHTEALKAMTVLPDHNNDNLKFGSL